jgi:tripartite ATP-independent transporter DctM subunit
MFGVAAPSEAASLGAVGAVIICIAYGRLNWTTFKSSILDSMRITAMVVFIALGAKIFTNVFLSLGGGKVIGNAFLALETSVTVTIILMLLLNFILGMLMDWIGLLFILVPVYVPIIKSLGVDPLWFGILFCITLQISYMTPPFAYSVFYLKGIAPPDVTLADMYRGAIPFVIIQVIAMILFFAFPGLSLWLPSIAQ